MSVGQAEERLFPIQKYDFETGFTSDDRQVLMGLLCPELVVFFFAEDGSLLNKEARLWNYPAPTNKGYYNIYDKQFEKNLDKQFSDWKAEIGFQPGTIRVKAFFDDDYLVGIEEVPEHMLAKNEPYSPKKQWYFKIGEIPPEAVAQSWEVEETAEEREEREEDLREWIESDSFVLWWAKDYWMSKDGEVEST